SAIPGAESQAIEWARRTDQVCTDFERAWQAGQRPDIEECLRTAPEAERPTLLRELILLEIEYRRRAGQEPRPADYRQRFPEHDGLIAPLFGASPASLAAGGPAADTASLVTGLSPPAAATDPSIPAEQLLPHVPSTAGRVLGDYELLEELGKG